MNNKLVVAIKQDNKVLREFNDTVYLKFGTEYSLLIKNLNSVKALVNISIDGKNVVKSGLIINPGQEVELERYVDDLNKGNRFKFIERTENIENHRGIKIDDGIVVIKFQFEKIYYRAPPVSPWSYPASPYKDVYRSPIHDWVNAITDASRIIRGPYSVSSQFDAGITVPGSVSEQKFSIGNIGELDSVKHSIVFRLLGEVNSKLVEKSVTVDYKPTCITCGRKNKVTAKFCSECGTSLTII